jgi:hypothetical protein
METKARQAIINTLQSYKHRYKNISIVNINNEETDIDIQFSGSDYKFIVTIKDSDKLVVFRDNNNELYHITATDEILNANTEIFIDSSNLDDPKVLVIENNTFEFMIIDKTHVENGKVEEYEEDPFGISNYFSDRFTIQRTGVVFN